MTSKEFLKLQLQAITKKYSGSTIEYYFDSFDNDHFVCISPNESLQEILKQEARLIHRNFRNNYPNELLSFLESESNLTFDELVFSYYPNSNKSFKTVKIYSITDGIHDLFKFKTVDEKIFPTHQLEKDTQKYIEEDEYAYAA